MGLPILLSLPWGLVLMSLFLLLRLLLTVHKGMIDHILPRLVTCVAIHRTVFASCLHTLHFHGGRFEVAIVATMVRRKLKSLE